MAGNEQRSSLSSLGTYAHPQPVHRIKEHVRPVGVARGQPELHAARAGRETESGRLPAAEIGGHPVKEFPAAAPRHQRQQRGVMPDCPFEHRHVDRRGYRGTQFGSFGKIIKDLLVGVEDIEVGGAGGGQVGSAARPAVSVAHAVEHADSLRRQQGHRADRNVLVRCGPGGPERDAQAGQEVAAEHLAPRRHGQVDQGGMVRERAGLVVAQVPRAVARTGRPVRVEVLEVDDQHVGLQSRQGPGHRRQGALRQFVVPVDEPDVLPRRLLRAQVAGGPGTDRGRRADDPQPGVVPGSEDRVDKRHAPERYRRGCGGMLRPQGGSGGMGPSQGGSGGMGPPGRSSGGVWGGRPPEIAGLAAARLWAATRFPYLATGVFGAQVVAERGSGTVSVDESWRMRADPELTASWTPAQLGSVLIHHVCHLLRTHGERAQAAGVRPDEARTWVRAADAEIDDDLVPAGLDLPGRPVLPHDLRAEDGLLAEQYFDGIRRAQRAPAHGAGGGGEAGNRDRSAPSGGGETAGPWLDCGSGADGMPRPGQQPGSLPGWQADLLRRQVAQDVVAHGKLPGTVPAGLLRWAEEVLTPKVNWRALLAAELRRAVAEVSGAVDYSYRRPSRRSAVAGQVVLPALRRPVPEVAVVCDTSGSMTEDLLAMVL